MNTTAGLAMNEKDAKRFWEKVSKDADCWEWIAATGSQGYGRFWLNGRLELPHRIAYENAFGPIPKGNLVDHTCHNKECVNPSHLRTATTKQNAENIRDHKPRSASGVRGVRSHRGRWRVGVKHLGVEHNGGIFTTLADAEKAAIALRNELFTHNNVDRLSTIEGKSE